MAPVPGNTPPQGSQELARLLQALSANNYNPNQISNIAGLISQGLCLRARVCVSVCVCEHTLVLLVKRSIQQCVEPCSLAVLLLNLSESCVLLILVMPRIWKNGNPRRGAPCCRS